MGDVGFISLWVLIVLLNITQFFDRRDFGRLRDRVDELERKVKK